ncbi:hypothetical protein FPL03_19045 [Xanthomonas citri pv. glycines]|nr:hypothetical protein FPK90_19795 [Xanthomonas citri pv. glycines]QDS08608.1 hypothetical protein FPL00_18685 [Xanthomonas citri pv. glycines]QDS12955.1 hypothetical protein FPL03_19045 [Xanthomonas citri pv. glycines]QDS21603.1 hypothetical protein FPL05_19420 [Xanthomonas citri pv. glycines]
MHGGLALGWLMEGGAGNGCPNDDQTGQCTSGVRGCRAPATACAGALVTGRGEVNFQTAILPMTFSDCRFAFDGECVKRLTRITDS